MEWDQIKLTEMCTNKQMSIWRQLSIIQVLQVLLLLLEKAGFVNLLMFLPAFLIYLACLSWSPTHAAAYKNTQW